MQTLTPYQDELAQHEAALEQALTRLDYPPAVLAQMLARRSQTMMAFVVYYKALVASGVSQAQRHEDMMTAREEFGHEQIP